VGQGQVPDKGRCREFGIVGVLRPVMVEIDAIKLILPYLPFRFFFKIFFMLPTAVCYRCLFSGKLNGATYIPFFGFRGLPALAGHLCFCFLPVEVFSPYITF
jgi:hypothetical protein